MITPFTYGRLFREKTDHIWWRFTASTCLAGQASRAPGKVLFLILVAFPQICLVMPFIILSKPWPLCCFLLLCSATRVTVMLLKLSCDLLALGTEGGGVHFLELPSLALQNKSLFQDEIMQRWVRAALLVSILTLSCHQLILMSEYEKARILIFFGLCSNVCV